MSEFCRELGISEAMFYIWKKKYANLGVPKLRKLGQLKQGNARLEHLVVDLTLGRHILTEVVRKQSKAGTSARADCLSPRYLLD